MKKILVIISGVVVIGGILIAQKIFNKKISPISEVSTTTPTPSLIPDKPTTTAPAVEKKTPKYSGQKLDYLADEKILVNYPQEAVEKKKSELAKLIGLIGENPEKDLYWIDIGLVKKFFENYSGARDVWEYAKVLNPRNTVIYYNLGSLYSHYLNDFKKAESNYIKAVQLDPNSTYTYLGLAEFYTNFYREKLDQTDDVLLEGLKNIPGDQNLLLNLAFYYKNSGDRESAIKYFEMFLKTPDLTGAQQQAIEEELKALKN